MPAATKTCPVATRDHLRRARISRAWLLAAAVIFMGLFASIRAEAQPAPITADQMSVRLGTHDDYTRVVFDFPRLTAYTLKTSADGTTQVVFDTPLTPATLPRAAGQITALTVQRQDAQSLLATLRAAPDAEIRHYRLMRRVVVDVLPPGRTPAAPPATAQATPQPTAQKQQSPAPAPPPLPQPKPEEITAAAKGNTPPKDAASASAPVSSAPADIAAATPPPVTTLDLPVDPALRVEVIQEAVQQAEDSEPVAPTTITVSTVEPTKIAVFERFGSLWVVMEGKASSATHPVITGPDEGFLGQPRPIVFEGGRAYRYTLPPNRSVVVSRKSLMWEITLGQGLRAPASTALLNINQDEATGRARLIATIKDTGPVLTLKDPLVGDSLRVVPVASPLARIDSTHRYANAEILPAHAGMVVRPIADDVRVTRLGDYVTVSARNGIAATPGASAAPTLIDTTTTTFTGNETRRLFDFPNWLQGGAARLNENRRSLEMQVADSRSPEARQEALLKLALLYFANNLGHETLGILRIISDDDPNMAQNPNFIALRGAAAALAGHYDEALKDLSTPVIQQHPEVNLWVGYAAAASEQWRRADSAFPRNNDLLVEYPPNIAIPMTIYMAESALRLGQAGSATQLLDTLNTLPTGHLPHYEAAIAYLRGEAARQDGRHADAIRIWTPVADGLDRLYHTKASLALTLLQLQEKQITPREAVDKIDSLRFAWRGDGLEVQILTALGRLRILNKQYLEGLQDLKSAAAFADSLRDDSTPIRQEMAEAVATLFTGPDRDTLNPLEAVSIYTEFADLLPRGEIGTAATLNFADYLVRMDLLDRAAGLITQALDDTPEASPRAEIGTRLATIYLLDGRPSLALAALDKSATSDIDADLVTRRTLLRARAQSQLNQTAAATATLANLDSTDARRLKADILWRARRWDEAARAIEALLPSPLPTPLDDDTARLIMNAAVGYKLAGNSSRLAALRSSYAGAMAATPMGPTFSVVTRDGGSASLADRDTILRIAGEVDLFKSLLDSYKATTEQNTASPTPPSGQDG